MKHSKHFKCQKIFRKDIFLQLSLPNTLIVSTDRFWLVCFPCLPIELCMLLRVVEGGRVPSGLTFSELRDACYVRIVWTFVLHSPIKKSAGSYKQQLSACPSKKNFTCFYLSLFFMKSSEASAYRSWEISGKIGKDLSGYDADQDRYLVLACHLDKRSPQFETSLKLASRPQILKYCRSRSHPLQWQKMS